MTRRKPFFPRRIAFWTAFSLRGMAEVANEATETARRIVALREEHRGLLVERPDRGAANGLKLLETLYRRPIFAVADVAKTLGVTPQAANKLTDRLVDLGLVMEITGQKRNRRFRYQPYIALFTDP